MAAKKPNSKRNLDMAIRRLGNTDEDYLSHRMILANTIVAQMMSKGVVKGGSALKLRFGEACTRATTDLDAARAVELDDFAARLGEFLAVGWEGCTGVLVPRKPARPKNVPPHYVMQPFDVKLSYLGRPWCTVVFELGHNEIGDADEPEYVFPAEAARMLVAMGFPKPSPIAMMPLRYQVAQKLHGLSEPRSDRVHDLIDLQVMVHNGELNLGETRDVCVRLFNYRHMQP